MKVLFHKNYDYRWPSRAVTAFKAGWSGRVKKEAGEAAIMKGRATLIPEDDKPAADAQHGPADSVGGGDPRPADVSRGRARRGRNSSDGDGANIALGGDGPARPGE